LKIHNNIFKLSFLLLSLVPDSKSKDSSRLGAVNCSTGTSSSSSSSSSSFRIWSSFSLSSESLSTGIPKSPSSSSLSSSFKTGSCSTF